MSEPPVLPEDENIPPRARRIAVELMPIFYQDIRRLARRERRRVSAGVTMQTTALVHEAYLKLHGSPEFNDREHFLRAAALAMRHVLVSHARERLAVKRGGGEAPVPLDEAPEVPADDDAVLLEMRFELGEPNFHGRAAGVGEMVDIFRERPRHYRGFANAGTHAVFPN